MKQLFWLIFAMSCLPHGKPMFFTTSNSTLPSAAKSCSAALLALALLRLLMKLPDTSVIAREIPSARILEAFIAKELQPWVRTFPAEYYQEMFRLRGLAFDASSVKRAPYFGHLTNDVVYDRLAPEVLEQLKMRIPRNDAGRPIAKFSQMLTRNVGYPKLREHLGAVVATMRLSSNWHDFKAKLDRNYQRYSAQTQTAFDFGEDDGCRPECGWNSEWRIPGNMKLSFQAARSIG